MSNRDGNARQLTTFETEMPHRVAPRCLDSEGRWVLLTPTPRETSVGSRD